MDVTNEQDAIRRAAMEGCSAIEIQIRDLRSALAEKQEELAEEKVLHKQAVDAAKFLKENLSKKEDEVGRLRKRIKGTYVTHEEVASEKWKGKCLELRAENQKLREVVEAASIDLEKACIFYCDWYDGHAYEGRSADNVTYDLVAFCRMALAKLDGRKG